MITDLVHPRAVVTGAVLTRGDGSLRATVALREVARAPAHQHGHRPGAQGDGGVGVGHDELGAPVETWCQRHLGTIRPTPAASSRGAPVLDHDLIHIRQLTRLHYRWLERTAAPYRPEYAGPF